MNEKRLAKQIWLDIKPDAYKNKWPKQALKYMGDVKYPFLIDRFKEEADNKGAKKGSVEYSELLVDSWKKWSKGIKQHINKWGETTWKEGIAKKSSLSLYSCKDTIRPESFYDNSWGSRLLF